MNSYEKSSESSLTHHFDGPTTNTSHKMLENPNLQPTSDCQVIASKNEFAENTSLQDNRKSVLPNSDIKNVVPTNDTPNEVLEGEASVVLNADNGIQS